MLFNEDLFKFLVAGISPAGESTEEGLIPDSHLFNLYYTRGQIDEVKPDYIVLNPLSDPSIKYTQCWQTDNSGKAVVGYSAWSKSSYFAANDMLQNLANYFTANITNLGEYWVQRYDIDNPTPMDASVDAGYFGSTSTWTLQYKQK